MRNNKFVRDSAAQQIWSLVNWSDQNLNLCGNKNFDVDFAGVDGRLGFEDLLGEVVLSVQVCREDIGILDIFTYSSFQCNPL